MKGIVLKASYIAAWAVFIGAILSMETTLFIPTIAAAASLTWILIFMYANRRETHD